MFNLLHCLKMQFIKSLPAVTSAQPGGFQGCLFIVNAKSLVFFFLSSSTRGNLAFVLFIRGSNHWNKLEKRKQTRGMRNNLQLNPWRWKEGINGLAKFSLTRSTVVLVPDRTKCRFNPLQAALELAPGRYLAVSVGSGVSPPPPVSLTHKGR